MIQQGLTVLENRGAAHSAFHFPHERSEGDRPCAGVRGQRWAIEIKLTSRPTRDDLASLNRNADLIEADRRLLVCRRAKLLQSGNQTVCDLEGLLDFLK